MPDPAGPVFDPALDWRLHPQVAVRPERFGALLYHFGTRRLSFLKDRVLAGVVASLDAHPDAHAALDAAGVGGDARYLNALGDLAASQMLIRRRPESR